MREQTEKSQLMQAFHCLHNPDPVNNGVALGSSDRMVLEATNRSETSPVSSLDGFDGISK